MRRISFALALLTAAAAGCSGGTAPDQGGDRGVAEGTFTVTVQNGQNGNTSLAITGGYVTSTPAGIDCGVAPHNACSASFTSDSTVTLTATPVGTGIVFYEWAGDCQGDAACVLSGKADKYILARFGTPADRTSHSNWSNPATHAAQYRAFALQCNACHGLNWTGLAIAPSCKSCHDFERFRVNEDPLAVDGHFAQDAGAWHDHNGWGQACLRCHTSQGYQDYVGVDGSPNYLSGTFVTDNALNSTTAVCEAAGNCDPAAYHYGPLTCKTCHNGVTDPVKSGITRVLFPSTKQVTTDRATALCGQCHQGRESAASVDTAVAPAAGPDALISAGGVGFKNPHYLGAAATLFGSDAAGWAQYPGKFYTGTNTHAGSMGSCTSCHDKHSGHLPADIAATCGGCHAGVTTVAELEASRMVGFDGDIDGDGDAVEGVKAEIDGLAAKLNEAMVAYSTTVLSAPITYTDNYPYYMNAAGTAYRTFSPRLMRAAVNYKWYKAEPGAWAHNPRYAVQVLFDAIQDLNDGLGANAIAFNGNRSFAGLGGHFDPSTEAFRHWDEDGLVSASCAKCHGGEAGFESFLADGSAEAVAPVGGMQCTTCHAVPAGGTMASLQTSTQSGFSSLGFVSGREVTTDNVTDLCGKCHQGRESSTSVNTRIGTTALDAQIPTATNSFPNPHYLGAAATLFGADAEGWAQYPGKVYTRTNTHGVTQGSCVSCHDPHNGALPADSEMATTCGRCHFDETTGLPVSSFAALEESRQFGFEGDIDGNGLQESLKLEIAGLETTLYAAIQSYAADVVGTRIVYDGASHPYFFVDADNDGVKDVGADGRSVQFKSFTPRLMRAAFNFKWAHAEPGAWAHNPRYAIEILFDAITDLNEGLVANAQTPVAFAGFRTFAGHFGAVSAESPAGGMQFADWDPGPVPANCSQCHAGAPGISNYLANQNTTIQSPSVTGMQCTTCHAPAAGDTDMSRIRTVAAVNFPPRKAADKQVVIDAAAFANPADAVCATCHTGRENGQTIADKVDPDGDGIEVATWTLSFSNPHYFGAAGVAFGADAGMMYQYSGNSYAGAAAGSCVACHDPVASKHSFEAPLPADLTAKNNLAALATDLYTAITAYSQAASNPVCYDGHAYPYWFVDDGKGGGVASNGVCDGDEAADRAYGARFDSKGLKAAFNYKWSQAELGAYAHNYDYMNQVLFDTIQDLGGTPSVPRQ